MCVNIQPNPMKDLVRCECANIQPNPRGGCVLIYSLILDEGSRVVGVC